MKIHKEGAPIILCAAALAIFRGLCRCVNEYARANPSKLS